MSSFPSLSDEWLAASVSSSLIDNLGRFCLTSVQGHGHSATDEKEYADWLHDGCCSSFGVIQRSVVNLP